MSVQSSTVSSCFLISPAGEEVDADQIKSSYYSILKEEKKKEAAAQLPAISGGDLALQGLMGPNPSVAAAAIASKVKINKGKVKIVSVAQLLKQILRTSKLDLSSCMSTLIHLEAGGFQRQPERVTEGPCKATSSHPQPL